MIVLKHDLKQGPDSAREIRRHEIARMHNLADRFFTREEASGRIASLCVAVLSEKP
jgi:hypothetical protein